MTWSDIVEKGHSVSVDESYDDIQKSGYIITYSEQNVSKHWKKTLDALFLALVYLD